MAGASEPPPPGCGSRQAPLPQHPPTGRRSDTTFPPPFPGAAALPGTLSTCPCDGRNPHASLSPVRLYFSAHDHHSDLFSPPLPPPSALSKQPRNFQPNCSRPAALPAASEPWRCPDVIESVLPTLVARMGTPKSLCTSAPCPFKDQRFAGRNRPPEEASSAARGQVRTLFFAPWPLSV